MQFKEKKKTIQEAAELIKMGEIGVFPTDTIYGLVGSALDRLVVERIYHIKKRNKNKPFIVLIGSLGDLRKFGLKIPIKLMPLVRVLWPGPVSLIFHCKSKKWFYLHRGSKTLAVRLPKNPVIRSILKKTGPLVAPSANLSDKSPAGNLKEAWQYFGDTVDFYVAGRTSDSIKPSTLLRIDEKSFTLTMLREGSTGREIINKYLPPGWSLGLPKSN